jgi:purine-cytosine permease-like protein
LVGRLVTDLLASINAFIGLIVIFTTPWMIIMMIGFFVRRGWYSPEDVQVFNKGKTGGIYWFNAGFNWRALLAWIPSAILGLMFCYYPPLLIGPWSGAVGGIDISLPVSIVSAAVLYVLFLSIWPEPKSAYGPKGSRLVRTK